MQNLILRPAQVVTETIVSITTYDNIIRVSFPQFLNSFRLLIKDLGYSWDWPYWLRQINYKNGLIEDRYIELCSVLLSKGFIVSIDKPELQERIISQDYQEEQTRWIVGVLQGTYKDWIAVRYNHHKENYYRQARSLPNSRYDKPLVVINPIYYDQIFDFAELYKFSITEKALSLLEQAKTAKLAQVRVELRPKNSAKKKLTAFGEEKKSESPDLIGVADEFLDQD